MDDFAKQKIIYPDIMRLPKSQAGLSDYPRFHLDKDGFYVEATNFFMTGSGLEVICAFLASSIGFYLFSKFFTGPQFDSTGFRYKKAYLECMPVPRISDKDAEHIAECLDQIIGSTCNEYAEKRIEEIFQNALGLTEDELMEIRLYKQGLIESR